MPRRLTVWVTNKPTGKLRTTRLSVIPRMSLVAAPNTPPLRRSARERLAGTAEVTGDLVTLHGVVERAHRKSCAEGTIRRAPSVIGVRNEIALCEAQEFG
jgi:hypothetical protein